MHRHLWIPFLLLCCGLGLPFWGMSQTATLRGTVMDKYGNRLDSVRIEIKSIGKETRTDAEGKWELQVPPGKYSVHFTGPMFKPAVEVVSLGPSETKLLPVNLGDRYSVNQVDITNHKDPTDIEDPDKVGTMTIPIDPKKITTIPGFKSDISSRLMTLAVGVTSNNELSSQYRVRGGNFDENLVYVNDIEIYRPLLIRTGQQEGLGFVNPNLASDVGFSSGGFQAKYADKLSSVLDVTYSDPTALHGSAELGILNQNFNIEGSSQRTLPRNGDGQEMIAGRFTYLMGARRFTPSYVLSSLDTKGEYKPRFADIQGMFTYAPKHVARTDRKSVV